MSDENRLDDLEVVDADEVLGAGCPPEEHLGHEVEQVGKGIAAPPKVEKHALVDKVRATRDKAYATRDRIVSDLEPPA